MKVKLRSAVPADDGRPTLIVHGMADVRLALSAGRPFRLLSAPGAATTLGVAWWRALADAAAATDDILDCGADGGAALEALRAGQRHLVLRGAFAGMVGEIAQPIGATILAEPPLALDLAQRGAPSLWLRHQVIAVAENTNE